jgi:hypothetical protein
MGLIQLQDHRSHSQRVLRMLSGFGVEIEGFSNAVPFFYLRPFLRDILLLSVCETMDGVGGIIP